MSTANGTSAVSVDSDPNATVAQAIALCPALAANPTGAYPEACARFDQYGVRVPFVAVSPFSKPHYVSHVVNDHTSILKFIATRFGLPPLTRRVAAANPMLEFFDFDHAAFARPPYIPPARVDALGYLKCQLMQHSTSEEHGVAQLHDMWSSATP